MKASVCLKYGPPEVLRIQEVEKPVPKDNEVLVKVYATTVNRTDLAILRAVPYFMRLFTGLSRPKRSITGCDFAGEIEATGKRVSSFKVGDRVMGFGGLGLKSHAEYLVLSEKKGIVLIPDVLPYDEAAGCLEATYYAASAVNQLKPKAGQKVLVNGATGAIGSAAVQIFKYYGVYLTAVCSGDNIPLVTSFGVDKIIDYKKQDFTKDDERYDLVFDAVGKSSFAKCKPLLKKKGIYTSTDGLINFLLTLTTPILGGKTVAFKLPKDQTGTLNFIKELVQKGKFTPLIDRKYPLDRIGDAYSYVATGQKIGNVIVTINS